MTLPSLPASGSTSWYPYAQGLDTSVRNLQTGTPTLDELQRTVRLGTVNATATLRLGPASFDERIPAITVATSAAVTASDTNYWSVALLRLRAGQSSLTIATRTSQLTGGLGFTADAGWNFDAVNWLETARHLRKDDVLALAFTKVGTPADLTDVTVAVRYQPGVQPLIRDTFNRADAAALGTTDTGQTWETPLSGTWAITSQQAAATALTAGYAYIVTNVGVSDFTAAVNIPTAGTGQGLVFRAVDYSNMYDAGPSGVFKTAAGTTTQLISAISGGLASGDTLTVQVSGPTITLFKNGIQVGQVTDSFNQTATRVGIWTSSTTARLDDLSVAV